MRETLDELFRGSMTGRTMYVVPFSMGPIGSDKSHIGVQCTDSAYVAVSMRIMTRMGAAALEALGEDGDFVPCLHSVGMPLNDGVEDVPWPCNADNKYIVHFPETREIWSYGSGYGGNALLGKKCLALRIASVMARDEGWMAEHMLILKLTSPDGRVKYVTGAFPSACGKTNLAMLIPTLEDWTVETIGDDIAWMKFGEDGRLYAINPEAGFFGVAPNTSVVTNRNAMATIRANSIFTNCARTDEGDIWWEGMTKEPPAHAIDWHGDDWTPDSEAAGGASQRPLHDARGAGPGDRARVGGPRRRADRRDPPRRPARDDDPARPRGVRLGARRLPRRDDELGDHRRRRRARSASCASTPSRCCRSAATTWPTTSSTGWRSARRGDADKLPRIFYVNWFRKDADGRFLWPGFGENSRVLEWVFRRCAGDADAHETPIGLVPAPGDLYTGGLDIPAEDLEEVLTRRPRRAARAAAAAQGAPGAASATTCPTSCRRSSRRSSSG